MAAGRKPKPTALHELHGTINATRHAKRRTEPVAPGDPLKAPPGWLSASHKRGWRYAVKHAPRNLLKPIDRSILTVWIEAEERHRVAVTLQAKLDRHSQIPLLAEAKDGSIRASPYLRIINDAALLMLRAAAELGFSPAARPRLSAEAPAALAGAGNDPWAQLKALQSGTSPRTPEKARVN